MKSPRARITVGELLFAVLIVALNCAVARHYYPTLAYTRHSYLEWGDQLEVMVGLSPLLNVAIVGVQLLFARKINSFRCERAINTRLSPSGFTYLSVHFFALGCLTCYLMPGVFLVYRRFLQPVTNVVEGIGSRVLSEETSPHGWLLLQCVMLGVFFSGPPVLLSCVGGIVAKRCAATLSRRRFLAMTLLVSLGFAGTALAVAATPQRFRQYHQEVNLDFQVVDKDSGEPIGTAFILIKNVFGSFVAPVRALTGPDGRARLTPRLLTFGERNSFRTMGVFESWGQWLEISAPGYETRRNSLTAVLDPLVDLERPRFWQVALVRGKTADDSFRDIAGAYQHFEIERDGRFTYYRSGGCFGTPCEEYGHVTRMGDEFVLTPVPHPGVEVDFSMTVTYRTIPWGECLYFCSTDDRSLQQFCRAGLQLADPMLLRDWAELRVSDREKPQTGLPRLPLKVWVKFALEEISLRNEESSLRRALDALSARFSWN